MGKNFCAIFPGQGSQSVNMGLFFYENSTLAKEYFDIASRAIDVDFLELIKDEEKLNLSSFTQPSILLISAIAYDLFYEKYKLSPKFALGHSLGEFSALYASGAITLENAIKLVHKRGELMQSACSDGAGMAVVLGLGDEVIEKICLNAQNDGKKVYPVNYNSDGQIVLAGAKEDLKAVEPTIKESGAKIFKMLPMSVASHCIMLEGIIEEFRAELDALMSDSFKFKIISNVNAQPYSSKSEALELLPKQLISPVLYKQSIKAIEGEVELFLEFGSSNVLKGLNKRVTKVKTLNLDSISAIDDLGSELN